MVKIKSFLIKDLILLPNCLYHFNLLFFNNMHDTTWNWPDTSECLFDLCLVD